MFGCTVTVHPIDNLNTNRKEREKRYTLNINQLIFKGDKR